MVAGKDAPTFGEAKNSWLTGTAAWTFVSISQAILGVQPELDGLRIDPCIPPEWARLTLTDASAAHSIASRSRIRAARSMACRSSM